VARGPKGEGGVGGERVAGGTEEEEEEEEEEGRGWGEEGGV
jgi:hypothetical protein